MKKQKSNSRTRPKSKPLKIGITFDFNETNGFFLKPEMLAALTSRGVHVIPLLPEAVPLQQTIRTLDGLIIPGGLGDVDPKLYGQEVKHKNVLVIRKRCDFEYKVLEAFLPSEKPFLAICWGFQILNVFLGGSLIQDIKSDRPSEIRHEQTEAKHLPTHWVHFLPKSRARKLFKSERLYVNSTHHQGVDRLADRLSPEGYSPDGILESFALKDHPYCIGVQWHPERLQNDIVIPSFLKACRRLRS